MAKKSMVTVAGKKAIARGKASWNKSRTAVDEFGTVTLDDGTYNSQITSGKFDTSKSGKSYFRLAMTVTGNDDEDVDGTKLSVLQMTCKTKNKTEEENIAQLAILIQKFGIDTSTLTYDEAITALEEAISKKPFAAVRVSTGDQGGKFVNLDRILKDEDMEDMDTDDLEEEEEEYEEEDDVDGEEEEDEEYEDEPEEEEESGAPEKGDTYDFKAGPRGSAAACEVMSCNVSKETVTLKRQKDNKVFKNIPWAKLGDQH